MKGFYFFIIALASLSFVACSKSESNSDPAPTPPAPVPPTPPVPEPDLASGIAGVYNLTKITPYGKAPDITGLGSLTITAISKTTARLDRARSFTLVSTGETEKRTTSDTCQFSDAGTGYLIKKDTVTWGAYLIVDKQVRVFESMKVIEAMKEWESLKGKTHLVNYTKFN